MTLISCYITFLVGEDGYINVIEDEKERESILNKKPITHESKKIVVVNKTKIKIEVFDIIATVFPEIRKMK